ncbi:hypothetical protein GT021_32405 [Streptomyces sp. SID5470]|nr:hypothetical protein [Streptomyces sp. SID5470]
MRAEHRSAASGGRPRVLYVVVRDGTLSGIVDFGALFAGDPARPWAGRDDEPLPAVTATPSVGRAILTPTTASPDRRALHRRRQGCGRGRFLLEVPGSLAGTGIGPGPDRTHTRAETGETPGRVYRT